MKKLLLALICICSFASAQTYIPVTTSPSGCLTDGSGTAMASGTLVVVGTDQSNNVIPYRAGSTTQIITAPITRTITAGSLATTLQLANPANTSPTNIVYRISIKDNATLKITSYTLVNVFNNDSGNFNLCKANLVAGSLPGIPTLIGPTGLTGPAGGNQIVGINVTANTLSAAVATTQFMTQTTTIPAGSTADTVGAMFNLTAWGQFSVSTVGTIVTIGMFEQFYNAAPGTTGVNYSWRVSCTYINTAHNAYESFCDFLAKPASSSVAAAQNFQTSSAGTFTIDPSLTNTATINVRFSNASASNIMTQYGIMAQRWF